MGEIWLLDRWGGRRKGTNKLTHVHRRRSALGLGRKREGGQDHIICEFMTTTATTKRGQLGPLPPDPTLLPGAGEKP